MGAPDLALQLPAEFTLAADKMEDTQEFTLPTGHDRGALGARRRSAARARRRSSAAPTIFVKGAERRPRRRRRAPEHVLALLAAGPGSEPIDAGVAFRLPAGAQLGVRIHYKKTWQFEGKAAHRSQHGRRVLRAERRARRSCSRVPIELARRPAPDGANRTITLQPHASTRTCRRSRSARTRCRRTSRCRWKRSSPTDRARR